VIAHDCPPASRRLRVREETVWWFSNARKDNSGLRSRSLSVVLTRSSNVEAIFDQLVVIRYIISGGKKRFVIEKIEQASQPI